MTPQTSQHRRPLSLANGFSRSSTCQVTVDVERDVTGGPLCLVQVCVEKTAHKLAVFERVIQPTGVMPGSGNLPDVGFAADAELQFVSDVCRNEGIKFATD